MPISQPPLRLVPGAYLEAGSITGLLVPSPRELDLHDETLGAEPAVNGHRELPIDGRRSSPRPTLCTRGLESETRR